MVEAYLDFLIGQALPEETYLPFLFFFVCPLTQPKDGKCQAAYLRVCGSSSNSTNQLADCELEVSLCLTRVRHVPRAISHITSQNVDVSHRKMVTFSSYHRRMSDRYIDLLSQRRWFVLPRLRVNRSMHHDASGGADEREGGLQRNRRSSSVLPVL